ncbi:MAG: hypothetical protein EOP05_13385 [Proteobacteria bacterium]|nr:MAG: hypothetical protein EOP05_13385 [Pseudomonadota bacterium]
MLNESWALHSQGYNTKLALVGNAWLQLQDAGVVNEDELYAEGDWSHASIEGGFVAALVLTRDLLNLDISKATYAPPGIDPAQAARLRAFLGSRSKASR